MKHILPKGGHHTGKAESEGSRPEDGDAAADYGQGTIPFSIFIKLIHIDSSSLADSRSHPDPFFLADFKNYPATPNMTGMTRYYTHPSMSTTGTVKIDGRQIMVKGESWFDHQ